MPDEVTQDVQNTNENASPQGSTDAPVVNNEVPQQVAPKETQPQAQDGKTDEADKAGAPDKYEDFSFPEDLKANEQVLGQFSTLAKELNLSQENAQKLIDIQTQLAIEANKAAETQFNETVDNWLTDSKADPEIGGADFEAKVATAKKALDAFGSQELIDHLDASGLGNHKEVLRFAYKIGKLVEEDRIHGSSGAKTERDAASILYPTMAQ